MFTVGETSWFYVTKIGVCSFYAYTSEWSLLFSVKRGGTAGVM